MKSPCMDCENKGCGSFHDKCNKYAKFRDEISVIRRNESAVAQQNAYDIEAALRMRRRRRKKTN